MVLLRTGLVRMLQKMELLLSSVPVAVITMERTVEQAKLTASDGQEGVALAGAWPSVGANGKDARKMHMLCIYATLASWIAILMSHHSLSATVQNQRYRPITAVDASRVQRRVSAVHSAITTTRRLPLTLKGVTINPERPH